MRHNTQRSLRISVGPRWLPTASFSSALNVCLVQFVYIVNMEAGLEGVLDVLGNFNEKLWRRLSRYP